LKIKMFTTPRFVEAGCLGLFGKKSRQNSRKHTQSGRSMIEMLGVLAIVGVLSAGGIAGYSMAMQSYKTTQIIEKVNLISTRVRQLYKGAYTGISKSNLISSGKVNTDNFTNPFGGDIGIVASSATLFALYMFNIPSEACTDLLTTEWGSNGVFYGIQVDDEKDFYYANGKYPISSSDAISACKGGNHQVDLVFK